MSTRHAAAALAALGLLAAPAVSHADPFVGRIGTTTATVGLRGTDGKSYQVSYALTALRPQGGSASYTLDIAINRCTDGACAKVKRYTTQLSGSQVTASDDMTSVNVRLTTLGTPMTLAWAASADPPLTPGVYGDFVAAETSLNTAGQAADLRATVWGATCRASGTYSDNYAIAAMGYAPESAGPAPSRSTPSYFVKHGKRRTTCLA